MGYPIVLAMSAYMQRLPYTGAELLVQAFFDKFPVVFQVTRATNW